MVYPLNRKEFWRWLLWLLPVLLLAAVPFWFYLNRPAPVDPDAEAKAVALVLKLGGEIKPEQPPLDESGKKFSYKRLSPVFSVNIWRPTAKVTDADLKTLAALTGLRELGLDDTKVTDAGMKHLAALKDLQELGLGSNELTYAGLRELVGLTRLRKLWLGKTKVTDAGMKHLAALRSLEELSMDGSKLTGAGLKELAPLTKLRRLSLGGLEVADEDLKYFAPLVELRELNVSSTKATSAGLKWLAPLKKLRSFWIWGPEVTDEALQALRDANLLHLLPRAASEKRVWEINMFNPAADWLDRSQREGLRALYHEEGAMPANATEVVALVLSTTKVTGAGLMHLAPLTNLRYLDLRGTPVKGADLRELAPLANNLRSLLLDDGTVWSRDNSPPFRYELDDNRLQALAEIKLVHALFPQAKAGDGRRPKGPDDAFSLDLSGSKVTGRGLRHLAALTKLPAVKLNASQLNSEEGLQALENLVSLSLRQSKVTDADLKSLAPLKNLQTLDLSGTAVFGPGLADLAPLTKLRTLTLGENQVTDHTLAVLGRAGLLHTLVQAKAKLGLREDRSFLRPENYVGPTTADIELQPQGPDDVVSLSLERALVTDEGLKWLTAFKNLHTLKLSGTLITGRGLEKLAPLTKLHTLVLHGTLTDEALEALAKAGLLHALAQATAENGLRPKGPGDVVSFSLDHTAVTDAGLKWLAPLTKLRTLSLGNKQVTDHTLAVLGKAGLLHTLVQAKAEKGLRPQGPDDVVSLSLVDTAVTGPGLVELAPLTKLHTLWLRTAQITDEALAALAKVGLLHTLGQAEAEKGLRPKGPDDVVSLSLNFPLITDEALKSLAAFKNLQTLDLSNTWITGRGLDKLAPLTKLRTLGLKERQLANGFEALGKLGLLHTLSQAKGPDGQQADGPGGVHSLVLVDIGLTDAVLKWLAPLENLSYLKLRYTLVNGTGLKELAALKYLETLDLSHSPVTAAGLKDLVLLKRLRTLCLESTQVTEEEIEELRKALPGVDISR